MGTSNIVAVVALILSIGATVLSVSDARQNRTVTTYNSTTDLTLQIDRIFIEYPHWRPHFYDDRPVPENMTDPDRCQVLAIAEFCLDILECIWDRKTEYSKQDLPSWRAWILDIFNLSPVLRSYFTEHSSWYPTLMSLHREERSAWWSDDDSPAPAPPQPRAG
ncbi:conserved exported hypothetical protein [Frankia sp. AiPs1]|uniref:hypothetical protein n=1 Tax=Frankia sp. AiPa1 TaxID=573492 RepID=UPI00202B9B4E|nr:hypothetical protein [Frankia sp. AiPa1]MCL9758720.1 hypothetical protein [Frankia sp. AiPa1]